jgi:hypothetical protein
VILRFYSAYSFLYSLSFWLLSSYSASISISAAFESSSSIFCLRCLAFSSSWSRRCFSSLHWRLRVVLASAKRAFSSISAETTTTSFALTELLLIWLSTWSDSFVYFWISASYWVRSYSSCSTSSFKVEASFTSSSRCLVCFSSLAASFSIWDSYCSFWD